MQKLILNYMRLQEHTHLLIHVHEHVYVVYQSLRKVPNIPLLYNYRPISLTSLVGKILEQLILNRINIFLDRQKILHPSQHGFRQGHSCQTQLLESVHLWAESLDCGSSTHIIFLDFSKAFDSVPHQKLLIKLEHIGIRGQILNWIQAFLYNRQQRVVISGQASEWASVTSGVPQGSIWAHCCSRCMSMKLGRKFTHTLGFLLMIVPSLGRLAQVLTWKLFKMTYIGSTNGHRSGS